jgi:hypothetical protein
MVELDESIIMELMNMLAIFILQVAKKDNNVYLPTMYMYYESLNVTL